uniref:Reverse transcriptase domain-containing protein n=1 Tax=Tanacetum cinerariifolium TaxID=118510 RepID=A0A699JG21_TANCI|nr:reverse transcriptase domain-containing protein [Tanacetum cinerariifolium]
MPRECLAIIESKSKVRYSRNKPVVAKVSTNTSTSDISPDVAELKATDGNVYRDNIQEFVSQAFAVNYNQGNTSYRPPMMSNQIRPPAYIKANDADIRNMQTQGQNMQNQLTNLTELITKFVNSNSASTSSSGTLPSNTIANPRSDLKAITTRSDVSYDRPQILPPPSLLPKVVENEPEATKDTVQPTNNESTEDVQPQFGPSIKSLLTNKDKLYELARTPLNEHYSTVLLKKFPKKLGDPRKFLIPCDFPGKAECLALADFGASINLMPLSVWNKLSLPDLTPTCMTLELVDRLISHPVGVAEDVYVKVEAFLNDDPSLPLPNKGNYLPKVRKELKICEAKSDKSSIDEPPEVELKNLPPHLEYAFLEGDDKLPVIIVKDLSVEEKTALITVLKSHKRAIAWKLSDIKGIDLEFCTHKILMEEEFEPAVQHQRRVNPKIHDVSKQEVLNSSMLD